MRNYADLSVGVLALQGDFERHLYQLSHLGVKPLEIRTSDDLQKIDGIIIPGGESTTMSRLLDRFDMRNGLTEFCRSKGVWGTCAGMIMLADEVIDDKSVVPLKILDISVIRNGYGRQINSFFASVKASLNGTASKLSASFIRAPKVNRIGENIKTLAFYNDDPVLLARDNVLASSFHTELDDDITLTRWFIDNFVAVSK